MDKEKQREALIEYMKMQQQKIRPSVNAADSTKPNMNNNNINKNSQCLSNVLVIALKHISSSTNLALTLSFLQSPFLLRALPFCFFYAKQINNG